MIANPSQRNFCPPLPTVCPECQGPIKDAVFWDRKLPDMERRTFDNGAVRVVKVILGFCSEQCRGDRRARLLEPALARQTGKPSP